MRQPIAFFFYAEPKHSTTEPSAMDLHRSPNHHISRIKTIFTLKKQTIAALCVCAIAQQPPAGVVLEFLAGTVME